MSTLRPLLRRDRRWLAATLAAGLLAAVAVAFAPADAVQGEAQRLMYLHVPAVWCAYLCFFVVLVSGLQHLRTGSEGSDRWGRAAGEAGVVLTGLTLMTGSVWGALVWGTWWAWDARVTSTVALGLVYVGYLALRGAVHGPRGQRLAAVVGVAGFLVVPVVHFSVVWWHTLHQPATILAPSLRPPLDPRMGLALAAAVLAVTVVTAWVVRDRALALRPAVGPSRDLVPVRTAAAS